MENNTVKEAVEKEVKEVEKNEVKKVDLNEAPFKKVFHEDDFDWLAHLVTEYILAVSAKQVVEVLGPNLDQKEFEFLFKNIKSEKITMLESLLLN